MMHWLLIIVLSTASVIANAKPLVIGVEDIKVLPHFYYDQKTNHFSGFTRDVFDAFGQYQGYEITYRALPVKRLYNELLSGKIDIKYPDNPKWGSADKQNVSVNYSTPVVAFTDGLMTLPENTHKSLSNINSIAFVRGFSPWILKSSIEQKTISISETSQLEDAIRMVLNHRADAVYLNVASAKWQLKNTLNKPDNALVFNDKLPNIVDSYYASSVSNNKVIIEFNQFLLNNKKLIQTLKNNYDIN